MFLLTIFLQIIYFRRPLLTDISGHYSLQIFLQVYSNIFQDTIICHLSTDIFTFFSPRHQYLQILSYIFDGNHCFRDISKDIFYVFSTPLPFHYGYFYRYFLILVKATLLPSDIDTDIYQNKLLTMSDLIATDTFHSSF